LQIPFLAEKIRMDRHVLTVDLQFTGNGPTFIVCAAMLGTIKKLKAMSAITARI
jgi:hypothetical protein